MASPPPTDLNKRALTKGPYYAHVAISRSMHVFANVAEMQILGCRYVQQLTDKNGRA